MRTNARSAGVDLGVKVEPWEGASSGPATDRRLIEAFLERDEASAEAAFRRLVELHASAVLRVCRDVLGDHHRAQDASQAVFLVLARNARSIRRRESLGSWLHGVALRVARRALDVEQRRKKAEKRNALEPGARSDRGSASGRSSHAELHEELNRLPSQYRLPIVLCYFEGYTQEEAARILGWPYGTVQTRLHRGRKRLREALARRDPERAGLLAAVLGPRSDPTGAVSPEWIDQTARAAVRFARYGGTGAASPSAIGLATAVPTSPSSSGLTTWIPVFLLAAGCLWIAHGRDRRPPPDAPTPDDLSRPAVAAAVVDRTPSPAVPAPIEKPTALKSTPRPSKPRPVVTAPTSAASPSVVESPSEPQSPDGRELFTRTWSPNDRRSHGGNGLGPVYNARACIDCHDQGGAGGSGPSSRNIEVATAVDSQGVAGGGFFYGFRMDFGTGAMEYRFGYGGPSGARRDPQAALAAAAIHPGFRESDGVLLHRFGIDATYGAWRSAIPGRHGRIDVRTSQRNPTPLFGVGLIDEIPDEAILAAARRRTTSTAQTRGRVSRVDGGRIGRFGWKAQTATVEAFVYSAAAGELGLDLPGRRQAEDPRGGGAASEGVDMDQAECDALVAFVRELPPPELSASDDPKETVGVREGERIFRSIGCAACHLPKLGDVEGLYSDLLLHDMGAELADAGSGYAVFGTGPAAAAETGAGEWRTPPLWGLRDSAPYLHDGRAPTITRAVLLHGGQGRPSAERFARLSSRRRRQVEHFLNALAAPGG